MFPGMIFRAFAAALLGLAALALPASAQTSPTGEHPQVVLELYTSQGCVQCPRANRLVGMLSREPGVLALTFPVGIWDYLGWRDTLARPAYSDRQQGYSNSLHVRGRFTPQLIFNGARQTSASDWDEARSALLQARHDPRPEGAPEVAITRLRNDRARVSLSANARGAGADIWLVVFDPGPVIAVVGSGVNVNRSISHYNLVDSIQRIGTWNGEATWFERDHCTPECAVIVQRPGPGEILAAAYTYRPNRYPLQQIY
jgi:hypothetical protein